MFYKLKARFKRHKFDLPNPSIVRTGFWLNGKELKYTKYTCIECGEPLFLDLWQMEKLPGAMAYGCGLNKGGTPADYKAKGGNEVK